MSSKKKYVFKLEGMSCSNCALSIEKHLQKNKIVEFNIDFANNELSVARVKNISENKIIELITKIGFKATLLSSEKTTKKLISKTEVLFVVSLIFTLPLLAHMFLNHEHFLSKPLVQLFLCLPVFFIGIYQFGISAIRSTINRLPNMDVLIFLGSSSAFFYSVYGCFFSDHSAKDFLFFETCATIITLVLLGNSIEKRSIKKTTSSIEKLKELNETIVKRLTKNGIEKVHFNQVQLGDILFFNSGERIIFDGLIVEGQAEIDSSFITGESLTSSKKAGDLVTAGSIIVNGNLKLKSEKVGEETTISKVIQLVKDAQNKKPKIQRIGDRVSNYFVQFVILISILTYITNFYFFEIDKLESFLRSIAVLVISCPCAMGLATPTAIMVGIGRAARNGVLVKGGDTLEKVCQIKKIIFDKTGTITTGKFKINKIDIKDDNHHYVNSIIYSLESHSSHPIAKSICAYLKSNSKLLNIENVEEVKGMGVSGYHDDIEYKIGSSRLTKIDNNNYDIFLIANKKLIASISVQDELKSDVIDIINDLKKIGIKCSLLSGDKKEKCVLVNNQIGFNEIFYEKLPEEKLEIVEESNKNLKTAMIGDGINDSPALSQSFVGISISNAANIAVDSSDVILLNKNNISSLKTLINISNKTLETIKQNLFWAFSYNIIAIPIAAMGLLNPMWAAFFMAFSDIVVVGNSLRLNYKKIN